MSIILQSNVNLLTTELDAALQAKYERLQAIFKKLDRVLVAFSGGVDSSLALKVALDTLGPERVLGVIAVSPSLESEEQAAALALLDTIGVPYQRVATNEVNDLRYAANPVNRCYFCKTHLFDALFDIAQERQMVVVDGLNYDDTGDHRPGHQAGLERGVRSPLQEAELTKADVRRLARHLGLPNWSKPAMACLSSRVPYGTAITPKVLSQIGRAERALRVLGLEQLRVRHHDTVARIEVLPDDMVAVLAHSDSIVAELKAAGYQYVTLDLQGFRSGSLNETLK